MVSNFERGKAFSNNMHSMMLNTIEEEVELPQLLKRGLLNLHSRPIYFFCLVECFNKYQERLGNRSENQREFFSFTHIFQPQGEYLINQKLSSIAKVY